MCVICLYLYFISYCWDNPVGPSMIRMKIQPHMEVTKPFGCKSDMKQHLKSCWSRASKHALVGVISLHTHLLGPTTRTHHCICYVASVMLFTCRCSLNALLDMWFLYSSTIMANKVSHPDISLWHLAVGKWYLPLLYWSLGLLELQQAYSSMFDTKWWSTSYQQSGRVFGTQSHCAHINLVKQIMWLVSWHFVVVLPQNGARSS